MDILGRNWVSLWLYLQSAEKRTWLRPGRLPIQNLNHRLRHLAQGARPRRFLPSPLRGLVRAGALVLVLALIAPVQAAGRQNVDRVWSNDGPLGGYLLGDFDGDGRTDLFRVVGTQWQYSAGGTGPWQDLAMDGTPLSGLRMGDFNGDGRTDVFSRAPDGRWRYSDGGVTDWIPMASDPLPIDKLRFGDFNGDGRTDVFSVVEGGAQDGRWRYSPGGTGGWSDLAIDNLEVEDLRFGYFDGDNRMDVFRIGGGGQWRFSSGGDASYQNLASDPAPLSELALGDFNGDGVTDVFNRTGGGQWRFSPGGTGSWVNLASDPTAFANLRFGDFNGDNRTDVFSIGPGGEPRYASGGTGSWQVLSPTQPPTPTSTTLPSTPIYALEFGDFNNDGRTDVFRTDAGQWQFSSAGTGPWQNLAYDPLPLSQLRFGDFNGDGRTDVFSRAPDGQWRYSDGGATGWIDLASDSLPLSELRFGDFNGDGRTDVFSRAPDGQWRFSDAAVSPWVDLASDPLPLSELRFGDFNGDGRTDVFSVAPNGRWRYSDAAQSAWIDLASEPLPVSELRFGDFNGDGRTDVFSRAPDGQWRFSDAGQSGWTNLASDPLPLNDLRFGDFNGDGRTDVFSISPEGRWRYSNAGQGDWILLGPPSAGVSPTPTVTRDPTRRPTAYPTVQPTGGPHPTSSPCYNVLDNGDFEYNGGWEFGKTELMGKYTGARKRSGIRSVQLGNPPDANQAAVTSYSSIRQLVSVPQQAGTVTLRWWRIGGSEEGVATAPSKTQDRQEVILLTPAGDTLKILQRVRRNDGGWQPDSVDLTEFAGQRFYVYFNVYNDGNPARTWMFLDDVALEVCPAQGGPGYTRSSYDAAYNDAGYLPSTRPYGKGRAPGKGGRPPKETHTPTPTLTVTPTPTETATAMSTVAPMATVTPTVVMTPTVVVTDTNEMTDSNGITTTSVLAPELQLDAASENAGSENAATEPAVGENAVGENDAENGTPTPEASLAEPIDTPISTPASAQQQEAECVELVNNGGFEAQDAGWDILSSTAPAVFTSELTFNRSSQSVRLGLVEGENRASMSAIDQVIDLPENASNIVLSFRYYPLYESSPGEGDLQYVDIYNAVTGQFAGRVMGIQSDARTWLAKDYDLTPLSGQSIRLFVAVNNDGEGGRTAMYVDSVSVTSCNFGNLASPSPSATATSEPGIGRIFALPGADKAAVAPDTQETVRPAAADSSRASEAVAAGGQPNGQVNIWLTRLGAIGVLLGVLGAIGFATLVAIGTLREPS